MRCTDRPGRFAAAFVVTPLLLVAALRVRSCDVFVSFGLTGFACVLFCYELFWIMHSKGFETAHFSNYEFERV